MMTLTIRRSATMAAMELLFYCRDCRQHAVVQVTEQHWRYAIVGEYQMPVPRCECSQRLGLSLNAMDSAVASSDRLPSIQAMNAKSAAKEQPPPEPEKSELSDVALRGSLLEYK